MEINLELLKKICNRYGATLIENKPGGFIFDNENKELNILGTLYQLKIVDDENFEYGGLVDFKKKTIAINKNSSFQAKELYHEIIHAFLFESGLHSNAEWSQNEEMVDWFAMQFDKIIDASRKGISYLMEK